MSSKVQITSREEIHAFVGTHPDHRLTALTAPLCYPQSKWNRCGDLGRAAQEGSYVMLRLFIEFFGVKGSGNKSEGYKLERRDIRRDWPDDLLLSSFSGLKLLEPKDFSPGEILIAEVHRTLCKINAHFTYDDTDPTIEFYDRVASLQPEKWERAVDIVVKNLDEFFYQKVGENILVVPDLVEPFKTRFPNLKSTVKRSDESLYEK